MTAVREFVLPADHPVLPGHFPAHPVVPGVILLSWCELVAAELAGVPITVERWRNVKFIEPLDPGQVCTVIVISEAPGSANFRVERDGRAIAGGRLEWRAAAA
ncbi:MAG: hypothetical protein ACKVQQ_02800 [Burkholderiales bacterium]